MELLPLIAKSETMTPVSIRRADLGLLERYVWGMNTTQYYLVSIRRADLGLLEQRIEREGAQPA